MNTLTTSEQVPPQVGDIIASPQGLPEEISFTSAGDASRAPEDITLAPTTTTSRSLSTVQTPTLVPKVDGNRTRKPVTIFVPPESCTRYSRTDQPGTLSETIRYWKFSPGTEIEDDFTSCYPEELHEVGLRYYTVSEFGRSVDRILYTMSYYSPGICPLGYTSNLKEITSFGQRRY